MPRWFVAVALLCGFALIRVAATHRVFSPTFDEPIHVAAGHQYLTEGEYKLDIEHPPLARMLFAFPFRHARTSSEGWVERGVDLYTANREYMSGVVASRRGNLLFFFIALASLTLWARDLFGDRVAVAACAIFSMLTPVLAHAALATTDMAGVAAYCAAMFALYRWIAVPFGGRTIALGLTVGIGLVTKFSFPLFFAVAVMIVMISYRRAPVLKGALAAILALFVVWGVYRFDNRGLDKFDASTVGMATELFGSPWFATNLNVPAPAFVAGLMRVALHDRDGHPAYFFGEVSERGGWWYYFPIVFAIKTPIPLMLFAAAGAVVLMRRREHREVILLPLAIMATAMTSNINLGLRHILPIYASLAILAAVGLLSVLQTRAKPAGVAIALWLVVGSLAAHPDYVPWANAFGGRQPERIVVDSNFDWGQDVVRLRTACRTLGITELGAFLFGTTDLARMGLPAVHGIDPFQRSVGWIAVSESAILPAQARDRLAYFWLTSAYSYRRVGKTIRLYHVIE